MAARASDAAAPKALASLHHARMEVRAPAPEFSLIFSYNVECSLAQEGGFTLVGGNGQRRRGRNRALPTVGKEKKGGFHYAECGHDHSGDEEFATLVRRVDEAMAEIRAAPLCAGLLSASSLCAPRKWRRDTGRYTIINLM